MKKLLWVSLLFYLCLFVGVRLFMTSANNSVAALFFFGIFSPVLLMFLMFVFGKEKYRQRISTGLSIIGSIILFAYVQKHDARSWGLPILLFLYPFGCIAMGTVFYTTEWVIRRLKNRKYGESVRGLTGGIVVILILILAFHGLFKSPAKQVPEDQQPPKKEVAPQDDKKEIALQDDDDDDDYSSYATEFVETEIQRRMQRILTENKRYPQPPEVQDAQRHGAEAKITLRVTDSLGMPVKNATVFVALYPKAEGVGTPVRRETDENGLLVIEGMTKSLIEYAIQKDGYYPNPYAKYWVYNNSLPTCVKDGKWYPWNPTVEVTLKEERYPIPLLTEFLAGKELPNGEEMGFDCKVGDWVESHGKGIYPDFTMIYTSKNNTWENLEDQLLITTKEHGGFLQMPLDSFSKFRSVYEAPLSGYEQSIKLERKKGKEQEPLNVQIPEDQYLIFRSRVKMDEKGDFAQSNYGKIYRLQYGHGDLAQRIGYVKFTYYFNPTENDRNLECQETWFGQ